MLFIKIGWKNCFWCPLSIGHIDIQANHFHKLYGRGVYIAQKLKLFRGHQKLFRGCNIRSLTFTSTVKPHSFEGCHDIYMNISNMTSVCTSGIAASCHVSPSILPCMCTGALSIYSNKWVFLILE